MVGRRTRRRWRGVKVVAAMEVAMAVAAMAAAMDGEWTVRVEGRATVEARVEGEGTNGGGRMVADNGG